MYLRKETKYFKTVTSREWRETSGDKHGSKTSPGLFSLIIFILKPIDLLPIKCRKALCHDAEVTMEKEGNTE